MIFKTGTIFKRRYSINKLIATGGTGFIYQGQDTLLKNTITLKQQPTKMNQFKQEATLLARLRHPALPRVTDYFHFKRYSFLVMDFIEGQSLRQILKKRQRPLTELMALDCLIQICSAVNYLHQQEPPIIHRDIKPDNIIITPASQAVLVDFGIAKEGANKTKAEAKYVTHGYSPPEQYGQSTSPQSDIYALGATLYNLLTNKRPPRSLHIKIGKHKLIPPHHIQSNISPETSIVVLNAMATSLENRPSSVSSWQEQLGTIFNNLQYQQNRKFDEDPTMLSLINRNRSTHYWLLNPQDEGYHITLTGGIIGRSPSSDIFLNNSRVSRQHARIQTNGEFCFILDESTNGTFINGERVGQRWYQLGLKDKIRIGDTEFRIVNTPPEKYIKTPVLKNNIPREITKIKRSK